MADQETSADQQAPWYFDTFSIMAELGHVGAQFELGCMYANGQGVPQNDAEAVKWFRLAAEQGHAEAQFELACLYTTNRPGLSQENSEVYSHKDVLCRQLLVTLKAIRDKQKNAEAAKRHSSEDEDEDEDIVVHCSREWWEQHFGENGSFTRAAELQKKAARKKREVARGN
ncbi:MAG: sel1 repeat family protein [Deltaproteobacteria bacterium]|nr:sel1 repeat family protein [Deltaproteobacteria bacterium]